MAPLWFARIFYSSLCFSDFMMNVRSTKCFGCCQEAIWGKLWVVSSQNLILVALNNFKNCRAFLRCQLSFSFHINRHLTNFSIELTRTFFASVMQHHCGNKLSSFVTHSLLQYGTYFENQHVVSFYWMGRKTFYKKFFQTLFP